MRDVRNYDVFIRAHDLVLNIYKITARFPERERESLGKQIRDSVSAIPIALINGNYKRSSSFFDYIQKAIEEKERLEYFLLISNELKVLDHDKWEKLNDELTIISKMLVGIYKKRYENKQQPQEQ